jgi:membrane-associated phospholipid phosphatase
MAAPAKAQEARQGPAYRLRLELDLPIVLIAGGVSSSFFFLPELRGVGCGTDCDRSQINRFDRGSAGNNDARWGTVGDIATATTLAAPVIVVLLDEGLKDGLNDDLVIAEAALVASAVQITTSFAVARPRPRVYNSETSLEDRTDANSERSFFSGHVANTMAASVAALRTFQRLRKPVVGWTMFGVGLAGTSLVGVSRVAAGAHFPSDVLVGAAMGAGIGLVLPAVHASGARVLPYGSAEGAGFVLAGALP